MNKFLAMLKDSYKEAIDGWLFQVMLIVSTVFIVLILSLAAKPVPGDRAISALMNNPALRIVAADRGAADRIGMFFFQPQVSDVKSLAPSADPWADEYQFTLAFASAGIGPVGVETNDAKNPTNAKQIEGEGFLANAFTAAVRYWASRPGEKKVKVTDELEIEFLKAHLREGVRFEASKVEKVGASRYVITGRALSRVAWPHTPSLLFGLWTMNFLEGPLGGLVNVVEGGIVNTIGAWVILLAGVVVTAGFVPNMLRKGSIDLMLTKPLTRPTLLLLKYLGGLLFVLFQTAFAVGGVWLAVGLKTGIWSPGILYSILGITFYFAILYAFSVLIGVLTRNAIVCIVLTIAFWFVIWAIGFGYNLMLTINNFDMNQPPPGRAQPQEQKKPPEVEPDATDEDKVPAGLLKTFEVLNRLTPRTKDLSTLTDRLVSEELISEGEKRQNGRRMRDVNWSEVLGIAGAYTSLFLGLALLRFTTRSY